MKKEMLINVLQPEECRIAILENGVLEELYVERTSHESYVGNIYKGRIVNIEPSIQAAFVDFGVGRNGFLHVSDVEPAYYRHLLEPRRDDRGDRGGRERGDREDRGDRGGRFDRGNGRRPGPVEPERMPSRDEQFDDNLSFEPLEPGVDLAPPAREEFEEDVARPEPPAPEPASSFAADVFDEPAAPAIPVAPAVVEAVVPPSEPDPEAPEPSLVALPETRTEEEEPVRRRRSRGTGGRRKKAAEPESEKSEEAPSAGESAESPKPKFMDSAERRTSGREYGPRSEQEVGSPAPMASREEEDDLLFFPAPAARPAPAAKPEPVFAPEPEPKPVAEEELAPEPVPVFAPPPRPRPAPARRGRIEDELRADLDAAEIAETDEEDVRPLSPISREPVETEFEEPEFDDEAPVRPERSDDRRDDRRDRRDDRRDDRRGRGRDDRRGGPRGGGGRRPMGGRPGFGRPKPLIQDIFKRGQEVIVQVIKEGIGSKGPTLSTYVSIAGRYLVLMPSLNRVGVSRKINDDDQRRRLRDIFNELKPPRGLGFIIRTAGIDRNKKELQRDLAYLSRLWQVVVKRIKKQKSPAEIYQESDMITRTIRDTFTKDIDTIWVDEPTAFEHAQEFLQFVMPHYANRIKLYDGKEPLFHKHGIEDEIVRIQQKKVPLPHGGSIVIEQTEALVAIDVNSGNFRADNQQAEETAYQMNLLAAKEIARQLRLRDLGGVIVNDFIDMRDEKHRRGVEKGLRDAMKRDRARTKILKISAFGIIEMTRQRIRPSLKRSVYEDCPYCHGHALVKTSESISLEVMRLVQIASCREQVQRVAVRVTDRVADYLLNKKRREIARLEEQGEMQVTITGTPGLPPETLELVCYDRNDNEVKLLGRDEPPVRVRR